MSSPAASHLTLLHPAAPHHASPHHASPHRAVPHIVILNDFGHINGGAGKVALDSAAALGRRGYRVTLLCAVLPVDPGLLRDNVRVECTEQFEIRADPDRLRAARQGIWNRKAVRALSAVLDGCDRANTIVHAHGWTKALSPACLHTALKRDFKVVVTLHEYFLACPNGGFFDYREQRICRRRPLSLGCMAANCDSTSYAEKLWRIGRQMVQRDFIRAPRDIRHFITVSAFSRDVIGAFLPQTSAIYPVPNPIDAGREPPIDVAANRGMLYVGRMAQEKGVMTLARAAQGAGLPVAYVGDGICRESVNRINPRAICTGWVDGEEVKRHMRLARALIFPSEWYETQGLVVLEAAAMGLPAIVSDACAAREMVVDGVTGLWFRAGDERDLAAKMALLEDPEFVKRLGVAAFERYWQLPFTMERHLEALEQCYERILSS